MVMRIITDDNDNEYYRRSWAGVVARIGYKNVFRILVWKLLGKWAVGKPRSIWFIK
jgi:hypothetical protein